MKSGYCADLLFRPSLYSGATAIAAIVHLRFFPEFSARKSRTCRFLLVPGINDSNINRRHYAYADNGHKKMPAKFSP